MDERNYKQESQTTIAICPRCGAICVEGHDDDGQIFCAKCGHSYTPKTVETLTDEEFKERIKGKRRIEKSSWIAYVTEID